MRECLLESVTEKPLHVVHIEADMTFEIDLTDHRPAHGFDRDRRIEMASMPHEQRGKIVDISALISQSRQCRHEVLQYHNARIVATPLPFAHQIS